MYNIKFKNILKNNLYIYISLVILYPKIHPNYKEKKIFW